MFDCIFCKIVNKELDAEFLYQDDLCVVFRDINPKSKVHLLIVPKNHIEKISDLREEDIGLMGHLLYAAKLMGDKFHLEGYKLVFNVGKTGGQEIFHVHLHLMAG